MKKKEKAVWLNYDLGIGGDYQSLYAWLDDHKAIECGNNAAYFKYSVPEDVTSDEQLRKYLKADLLKKVNFAPTNRIYVTLSSLEPSGKIIGTFLVGKRKANLWEGFGSTTEDSLETDD